MKETFIVVRLVMCVCFGLDQSFSYIGKLLEVSLALLQQGL